MPYQSIYRAGLFAGQTIIVTGGGSGIGRCTAHELTSLGAHVALVGRKIDKLDAVRAEIIEDGGGASCHVADIREEALVIQVIEDVLRERGRIDALVNNAGGQYRTAMKTISTKGFEAVVRSNLTGGFIFMREVFNRWMEAHGGSIVNMIADIWHGWPDYAHSGAARGGMLTLTETAACEWAASGVRVNCVAPSAHRIQRLRHLHPGGQGQDPGVSAQRAAAALRHRSRDLVGDRLSAVAGCVVHHRLVCSRRRRHAELPPHLLEAAAGAKQRALRRLPPRGAARTAHARTVRGQCG